MKIFVGNLSVETGQPTLRRTFEEFGEVSKVSLAVGKTDGLRKGFGFVDMPSVEEAKAAISELDGSGLDGRILQVHEARPGTVRSNPGQN